MKKFSPFLLVIVVLVFALAALGVGYGLWYENLTIDGTVNTGTVDVIMSHTTPVETVNGGAEDNAKAEAANCYVSGGENDLSLLIDGAYPGWACKFDFRVTSTGSVPVHLDTILAAAPAVNNMPPFFDDGVGTDGIDCNIYDENNNFMEHIANMNSTIQLHTGYYALCNVEFSFSNDDTDWDWTQAQQWGFAYDMQAHQYNEAADFTLP